MKLYLPERMRKFPLIDGLETTYYEEGCETIYEAEILVGYTKALIESPEKFKNLKFLHLLSSGFDHIPLKELSTMGVLVANAKGLYSIPIAEYCLAHTLSFVKELPLYEEANAQGKWNRDILPRTLEKGRALVLGTGSIGFELAKRLKAFDVYVIGVNSNGRKVDGFDMCVSLTEINDVVGSVDYIYSALPSNKTTYHCLTETFFENLKEGSLLINVGRGDVLDEAVLGKYLNKMGRVVLDVFSVEPLPQESFLWKHPKVLVTPHISFRGDLNEQKSYELIRDNISLFIKNEQISNIIN